MREALGDRLRELALQARDLRPQRRPRGPLVDVLAAHGGGCVAPAAGTVVTQSADHPLRLVLSVDDALLIVGHTRLLSGEWQFYQRT